MTQANPFYLFISYFSAFILIAPLILGIIKYRIQEPYFRILTILLCISFITELYSFIAINFYKTSNIWAYNIYVLTEGILIALFYFKSSNHRILKWIVGVFIIAYLITSVYEALLIKNNSLNNISITFESVMIISLSILTFFLLLKFPSNLNILSAPIFWANTAFLIYFSGNIFLHLFSKFLFENALYAFYELWGLWHSLLNIVFYLLISIAFWKSKTSQT
jgi:hypothetical protein